MGWLNPRVTAAGLFGAVAFGCGIGLLLGTTGAAGALLKFCCLDSDFRRCAGRDPSARDPLRFLSLLPGLLTAPALTAVEVDAWSTDVELICFLTAAAAAAMDVSLFVADFFR